MQIDRILASTWPTATARPLTAAGMESRDSVHLQGLPESMRLYEPRGPADLKHTCVIGSFEFTPDGTHILTTQWDDEVRLWDLAGGEPAVEVLPREERERVGPGTVSPDGRTMAVGYDDGVIRILDRSGAERFRIRHSDPEAPAEVSKWYGWESCRTVAFSPDSSVLASGGQDLNLCLWEAATGQLKARLDNGDWVCQLSWSPDGSRLFARTRHAVNVWNTATLELVASFKDPNPEPIGGGDMSLSRDGRRLAVVFTDHVQVFDTESGADLGRQAVRGAHRVAVSPDGQNVLIGQAIKNAVTVWNLPTGEVERQELPHEDAHGGGGIRQMGFSPDGQKLAISLLDYSLTLWVHRPEKTELGYLAGHLREGNGNQVRRVGDYVLVGSVRLPVRKR
ncbi:MAG: hypothetical protein AB1758_21415 [Candidatus Eremiobacterota bacterium]